MSVEDHRFRQVEGVWGIDINREDGKKVKSDAGTRWVPVHSELVRLGLLEYVGAVRETGHTSVPLDRRRTKIRRRWLVVVWLRRRLVNVLPMLTLPVSFR